MPKLPFKNKHMSKYLILFLFLLFGSTVSWAQPGRNHDNQEERFERIKEAKEVFLREELALTEAEAAAFFPLYWQYDRQTRGLRRPRRNPERQGPQRPALTEAQAREQLMTARQQRQHLLDLQIEAETAYLKHLPATKVILLGRAEREFREKLLRRLRQGRSQSRN